MSAASDSARKPQLSYLLATWFGLGYSRYAPGTLGSLGALPVYFILQSAGVAVYAVATLGVTLVGFVVAERVARHEHKQDPGLVVIDEVAGTLIALGMVGGGPLWLLAVAFLLFRLLDITKPWPIHRLEHVPPAGLGIMLDDLLAGLLAGAISQALGGWIARFG